MTRNDGVQELVNDMNSVEQRSYERMAGWMKHSYHGECSAVSAVHKLASQAAYTGQPLPFQLELQVATQPLLPLLPTLIFWKTSPAAISTAFWCIQKYLICMH